jgi:beta-RFAP synthase
MSIFVSTPSRLHFGLLRFEQSDGPSFGGLGMMIDRPRVELEMSAAGEWSGEWPEHYAEQALAYLSEGNKPPAVRIKVRDVIPRHFGLGSGTQMALAVAAGVRKLAGLRREVDAAKLSWLVGRGQRSAIGSHGFIRGGLIWEKGRQPNQWLAPMSSRVAMPKKWRVVLVTPATHPGLSGGGEQDAFSKLPPVPASTTEELERLAEESILPAARCGDLAEFGEAVYKYGRTAGECFAPVQGGPYASVTIADWVETIRALGVRGAGQTSWGPTIFAIVESQGDAESLMRNLSARKSSHAVDFQIARPDNRGAVIDESWNVFRKIVSGLSR